MTQLHTLRRLASLRISIVALITMAFIVTGNNSGRPTVHAQTNPIVTENGLAGSPQSEWDISGSGDPSIQGFATDISVNKGGVVTFKIKLQPDVIGGFKIDVYRLGYYQGFGARKVAADIVPTAAQLAAAHTQPACVKDPSVGLVDCGNWGVSGTFDTTGLTTGVYIARLKRDDTLGASHIVFIVRDDSRKADMLFQTSDTTWQAYNQYPGLADGGSSLYCNGPFDNSTGAYSCASRSAKVSYNRPFDTRDHDKKSWLFNGEYPMIRWLEANGYDVKYWAGVDTDRFGANPTIGLTSALAPKAFLSVGHDEYWSGQQRTNVEHARDAGVHLAFFSGNEAFWKTRYEASIDGTNTSYRTLVSYKETFAAGSTRLDPDPNAPWTGTWRDPRFSPPLDGGRPENGLTGQLWTVNCCSDRITVPAAFKNLRFWRNTAVANLAPGGVYLMPMETLGYEWDEDIDNGARPSGLMRLSSTTIIEPQRVTDYGINVAQGSATHSLTMYKAASGAWVFGAGTVQWSYGLDAVHDELPAPPDRVMQQATVNLLADMGVQPQTLQPGADGNMLVPASPSPDTQPPTSAVIFPSPGSTLASGTRVTITGQAIDNGGGNVAGVEVSTDGATWHPAVMPTPTTWAYDFKPGAVGTATLRTRAVDDNGNVETPGPGTTVTIGPGDCPCTTLWKPTALPIVQSANDPNPVELGLKFYSDADGFITGVRFYKGPLNSGTHIGNLWRSNGTLLASATFAGESASGWQQVLFGTPVAITANTTYVVSYHTNVGNYAADAGYLTANGVDSPPLHAATTSGSGGNGLFGYGVSQFPTQTFGGTNYWVDVVFSPSLLDTTPPVISKIKATIIDSSRVTITWTTDEPSTSKIEYSTDPELLTSTTTLPPGTVTINQSAFTLTHTVQLTGLTPNTTYYYRVISVDKSGNDANVAAPTFTLPGPTLRDTSSPDFAAGSLSGTYVSETVNGEVILAPTAGTEFSGSALDPGWTAFQWDPGGIATVADGTLLVDGMRVGSCVVNGSACDELPPTMSPGHLLEFVATFSGDAFQHAGFGQLLDANPWAIFSTGAGGTLKVRSFSNGGVNMDDEVPNGPSYLGFPHRYGIDWEPDHIDYYIDGTLVKTHALVVLGPMRPIAASDLSLFGGDIVVDWTRVSPYAAAGSFMSRIFDAGLAVDWHTIQWSAPTPAGTTVGISVRTGDTPTPDTSWTAFQPIASAGPLTLHSRYIQYQAALSTGNTNLTPSLDDIIISTGHAPVAVNDSITVPVNGLKTLPPTGPGSLVANDTDVDGDALEVSAVGPAAHGTTILLFDGSVRYIPQAGYSGADSFAYTVSDGLMTSSATVSVSVQNGNIAPVAADDAYTINEDTVLTVGAPGVLANDTDAEHAALTAAVASPPLHGLLSLSANGAFTYTPAANYNGPDAFTYTASDGQAASAPATVTINVLPVNDPPVTVADAYVAAMNQTFNVTAARGVLANDHDVETDDPAPLHTQLVSQPGHGALTLNADGSFAYTPNTDYLGTDSFTYAAVDHLNAVGNTVTVTITVAINVVEQAVNAGGTVSTGSAATPADPLVTAVTVPSAGDVRIAEGVIAGSQPPAGFTFLNQQVNITVSNPDGTEMAASLASPIRLAFSIDGSLLLPGQTVSTMQVFRNGAQVSDCLGSTTIPSAALDPCVSARTPAAAPATGGQIVLLTSHASIWNMGLPNATVGTAPRALNDGPFVVDYQTILTVPPSGVLGNDYGKNGLTAVLVPGSAIGGTVTLSPSGGFVFTPSAGFCGAASFSYTATDGVTQSAAATVSILIDCAPHANNDAVTVLEDSGATTIAVLSNDTDPDAGQSLTLTGVSAAANGVASVAPGGTAVTYTPQANFFGADSFTYTVSDGHGGTSTATVSVTVTGVNDVPGFTKGASQSLNEDAPAQSIAGWATGITAGPPNESGQLIDFLVSSDKPTLFSVQPAVSAAGALTFTPAADANGTATVTVKAHDNGGVASGGVDTSAAQTFTIAIAAVNDAPSFTEGADQSVTGSAAQTVPNWATAISAGPADEAAQTVAFSVTGNSNAALFAVAPAVSPTGTLTYTPAATANGSATITLVLKDNGGTLNGGVDTSAPVTFLIVVANTPVNHVPSFIEGPDVAVLEDSGAKSVSPWATAISAGAGDTGQVVNFIVSNSNNALFSAQPAISAAGVLTFTPAPNANGVATVTVQIHDNGGVLNGGVDTSSPRTFLVTVTAVNDAPSFVKGADQNLTGNPAPVTVNNWATAISAGPADEAGQVVSFTVTNNNAALFTSAPTVTPTGTLLYTIAPNVSGTAVVTVVAKDTGGVLNGGVDTSAAQTFNINVNKASTTTVLTSNNMNSLFGVPLVLKATVAPVAPGTGLPTGTMTFKDGATTLGTAPVNGGIAVFTTTTLAVGTHSLTAVYAPTGNYLASTSNAISVVIKPSAILKVNFVVHAMLDPSPRPIVKDFPVVGAQVEVFTRLDSCTNGLIVLNLPALWGRIFDGADGLNPTDPGCTPVSLENYQAVATTDALGNATIIVPPTATTPNQDYIVIARTTSFNYIATASATDPLYSEYTVKTIGANTTKSVPLHQLATFDGTLLSAKQTEFFGSYLDLVQPESVDWTDETQQYPFVMISQGSWDVTTSVTPPAGFVPDQPAIAANSTDTTTAVQFTLTDVGSDWTQTTVNNTITHLGVTTNTVSTIPMVNKRRTKARIDNVPMMATDKSTTIAVLANDYLGVRATSFKLTSFTQPTNGLVTAGLDGATLIYTPNAGFTGLDSFTYTITDDTGFRSTGPVNVKVFPTPGVRTANTLVTEGNAGTSQALVTFGLTNQSTLPVTVAYSTVDGTATAGSDYIAKSGTVTFNPGETRIDVPFDIIGDVTPEPNETFTIHLANATNATIVAPGDFPVRIVDDDAPTISTADNSFPEGDANRVVTVNVKLSQANPMPVTVNYKTTDGTALAGADYIAASGTLTFSAGQTVQQIPITLVGDTVSEPTERFFVDLLDPVNATVLQSRATITIVNDDNNSVTATTSADFLAGTVSGGAQVQQTLDGEVSLAPKLGSEFFGTALPAGWKSALVAGGSAVVANGSVAANGATLTGGTTTVGAVTSLEFVATFTGINQVVGLGNGTLNSPLAAFVIKPDGNLYSRTVAPNASGVVKTTETLMAGINWKTPHTYRIDVNASKAAFGIDGTLMASHPGTAWGTLAMGPMIVDSTVDASAVSVDYMRLSPSALSGAYTQRFDAGVAGAAWGRLQASLATPVGTSATVTYRSGETATPDATWTAATKLAANGPITATGRYLEITVQLNASTDGSKVPVLKDLTALFRLP